MTVHVSIDDRELLLLENTALRERVETLTEQLNEFKNQLDWFKSQLFGSKSEKRLEIDTSHQADLLAQLGVKSPPLDKIPTEHITYERRIKQRDAKSNV